MGKQDPPDLQKLELVGLKGFLDFMHGSKKEK